MKAAIGLFITLEPPTPEMARKAISAGYYTSQLCEKSYPRMKILTINELLSGAQPDMPPAYSTFKQAQKEKKSEGVQGELGI